MKKFFLIIIISIFFYSYCENDFSFAQNPNRQYILPKSENLSKRIEFAKKHKIKSLVQYCYLYSEKDRQYHEFKDLYEEYNISGNVLKTVNNNDIYEYFYDQYENLILKNEYFNKELYHIYKYQYLNNSGTCEICYPHHNVTGKIWVANRETLKFDDTGNLVELDSRDKKEKYKFNTRNLLIEKYEWRDCRCDIGGTFITTNYEYDSNENVIKITTFSREGENVNSSSINYRYEKSDNYEKIIFSSGSAIYEVTLNEYDKAHNLIKIFKDRSMADYSSEVTFIQYDDKFDFSKIDKEKYKYCDQNFVRYKYTFY